MKLCIISHEILPEYIPCTQHHLQNEQSKSEDCKDLNMEKMGNADKLSFFND